MLSAWKCCPTWQTQKRMLATKFLMLDIVYPLSRKKMSFQDAQYVAKEYFFISRSLNFFLRVRSKCILLSLNGMSKAAIPRSNTVHSHVQILLLMRHSYKVCVNPQQVFSAKSQKARYMYEIIVIIDFYWQIIITNQSTVIDKYRPPRTDWLIVTSY